MRGLRLFFFSPGGPKLQEMLTWQGRAQVAQDRGKATLLKEAGRQLTWNRKSCF